MTNRQGVPHHRDLDEVFARQFRRRAKSDYDDLEEAFKLEDSLVREYECAFH